MAEGNKGTAIQKESTSVENTDRNKSTEDTRELVEFFNRITGALTAAVCVTQTESGKSSLPMAMTPYDCVFAVLGGNSIPDKQKRQRELIQNEKRFPKLVNKFVEGVKDGIKEEKERK